MAHKISIATGITQIQFSDQGLNPDPLLWECGVLTTSQGPVVSVLFDVVGS